MFLILTMLSLWNWIGFLAGVAKGVTAAVSPSPPFCRMWLILDGFHWELLMWRCFCLLDSFNSRDFYVTCCLAWWYDTPSYWARALNCQAVLGPPSASARCWTPGRKRAMESERERDRERERARERERLPWTFTTIICLRSFQNVWPITCHHNVSQLNSKVLCFDQKHTFRLPIIIASSLNLELTRFFLGSSITIQSSKM